MTFLPLTWFSMDISHSSLITVHCTKPSVFNTDNLSPSLFALPKPLLQSLGLWPRACKLAGMVEKRGGYDFSIKGKKQKKQNSSLSNKVHNSPLFIIQIGAHL